LQRSANVVHYMFQGVDSLRGASVEIGTMQRSSAWLLRNDDEHKSRRASTCSILFKGRSSTPCAANTDQLHADTLVSSSFSEVSAYGVDPRFVFFRIEALRTVVRSRREGSQSAARPPVAAPREGPATTRRAASERRADRVFIQVRVSPAFQQPASQQQQLACLLLCFK